MIRPGSTTPGPSTGEGSDSPEPMNLLGISPRSKGGAEPHNPEETIEVWAGRPAWGVACGPAWVGLT